MIKRRNKNKPFGYWARLHLAAHRCENVDENMYLFPHDQGKGWNSVSFCTKCHIHMGGETQQDNTLAKWSKGTAPGRRCSDVNPLFWCTEKGQHHIWRIFTKNAQPHLIMKKYQTNASWGTSYKIPAQVSLQMSRRKCLIDLRTNCRIGSCRRKGTSEARLAAFQEGLWSSWSFVLWLCKRKLAGGYWTLCSVCVIFSKSKKMSKVKNVMLGYMAAFVNCTVL